ncbi:class I SAM-dependent methyltransferase [Syntrophomonas wolfei]|jgi:demethylmenaquinone methyltransferase/2-methoxy-6-polyprenyl-1,4-benzoquinol methylase|uniref:class I SAM-dependent methyltransferase n=1 Tax=Syntrophomonas wolfei TaxID=863 RepID=UPI0023EF5F49|nr:class I SAM-dependent methyltransferase [Syntrophomonas wolfei]
MNSSDISTYEKSLLLSQPLREPGLKNIIQYLPLPSSGIGLDIGCGTGFTTFMLAEALGPAGSVIGFDIEERFLQSARLLRQNKPQIRERVEFVQGNAGDLPFSGKSFDWAVSIDCVGVLDIDPVIMLKEIGRVLKPGGRVFIIMWSSQMLLPGYPLLEAQLNATAAGIAPFKTGMAPDRHIMRAPEWFRSAGFQDIQTHTCAMDVCSPLSAEIIVAVSDLFIMRWGSCEKEVAPEIWHDYQRLCQPDSTEFILNVPGYYAFFTYSVFSARNS